MNLCEWSEMIFLFILILEKYDGRVVKVLHQGLIEKFIPIL